MRYAVVGAGFWVPFQIHGWLEVGAPPPVAICNRTRPKAEALAARFGIPNVYESLEEMLDRERLDFLDVATGVEAHAEAVFAAVDRRLPVVCQKPMGVDLAEARRMVQAAGEANVPFFVNENWRYQAPMRSLKRLLDRGAIGKPFRARLMFNTSFPVFVNQPALARLPQFILTDVGSHVLDCARCFFGEANSLYATTYRVNDIVGEDVATVVMAMDGCPTVTVELSYGSRLPEERFPETFAVIEGTEGSLDLRRGGRIRWTRDKGTEEIHAPSANYPWLDPAYEVVHASIVECQRDLYHALTTGATPETVAHDNLRTVELVFAAYRSADEGRLLRREEWT